LLAECKKKGKNLLEAEEASFHFTVFLGFLFGLRRLLPHFLQWSGFFPGEDLFFALQLMHTHTFSKRLFSASEASGIKVTN